MYLFSSVEWRCAESNDSLYFGGNIRSHIKPVIDPAWFTIPFVSSPNLIHTRQ